MGAPLVSYFTSWPLNRPAPPRKMASARLLTSLLRKVVTGNALSL